MEPMLVVAALLAQNLAQTQGQATASAWLATLTKVARTEHASLCADVDDTYTPAQLEYERPDGERGMDRVSGATDRTWTLVEGVYVFRRRYDEDDLRLQSPDRAVMDFLLSLGVTDLQRLRQGDLAFSTLPAPTQRRLRWAIAKVGRGVGDSMLAQYPDSFGMRLVLDAVARAQSRTGDGAIQISLQPDAAKVPPPKGAGITALEPLGRPSDGGVDFGDGVVITLGEIIDRAQTAFGRMIQFDDRLRSSRYFMSGRFTQPRLLAVVAAVTEPLRVLPAPESTPFDPNEFKSDRDRLVGFAFGSYRTDRIGVADLTIADLIDGRTTTFASLFGNRLPQSVSAFMYQYRLEPNDTVEITGELYLAFAANGLAFLSTGERDLSGRPIQYNAPLYVKFKF